jgi:large subunit ribosomal protein L10
VVDGKERKRVNRSDKERTVEDLKAKFARSDVAVLTRFMGLKVSELNQLRYEFKRASMDYHVVKNTLVRRAIEGTDVALLRDYIEGPIAIAFAETDLVSLAKVLAGYQKDHPSLQIHVGLAKGRILEASDIQRAATLPDREELVAKVMFLLNVPLTRLMMTLKGIPTKVVRTLGAIQEQKEKMGQED